MLRPAGRCTCARRYNNTQREGLDVPRGCSDGSSSLRPQKISHGGTQSARVVGSRVLQSAAAGTLLAHSPQNRIVVLKPEAAGARLVLVVSREVEMKADGVGRQALGGKNTLN